MSDTSTADDDYSSASHGLVKDGAVICQRPGCRRPLRSGRMYCGKSCAVKHARSKQTPEKRREISRLGRQAQRKDDWERFKARIRLASTEDARYELARKYGYQQHAQMIYKKQQREKST